MATNTYVAIPGQSQVLTSSAASVTFTSIPQTYTDLVLVSRYFFTTTGVRFATFTVGNGTLDTGTNYSDTYMDTYPGTPNTGRNANNTSGLFSYSRSTGLATTAPQSSIANFMNYSNTTNYKTILNRNQSGDDMVSLYTNMWRSNSAINTIRITAGGSDFASGSTFTLYGIANSNIGAPKAFGGTITQDATYTYHTFGASGTFTPQQSLTCDYLVVAGGGGGGVHHGGGGGAGGLRSTIGATGGGGTLESAVSFASATPYTITIGGGGAGSTSNSARGTSGVNSSIIGGAISISSTGGGGGGSRLTQTTGASGGSGGGAGYDSTGGAPTSNQGFGGGNDTSPTYGAGGGGGGAGAAGARSGASSAVGGAGGIGVLITALAVTGTGFRNYYAGGGGGGGQDSGGFGLGGEGGGGNGTNRATTGAVGIANTGGGGGGGGYDGVAGNGGAGGSGLVIIRYAN
jgi:hypothetical protein